MGLTEAVQAYEESMKRAILMCKLEDLANSTNGGSVEDMHIGYVLRVVWVAIHTGHIAELDALLTPLAEKWMDSKQ